MLEFDFQAGNGINTELLTIENPNFGNHFIKMQIISDTIFFEELFARTGSILLEHHVVMHVNRRRNQINVSDGAIERLSYAKIILNLDLLHLFGRLISFENHQIFNGLSEGFPMSNDIILIDLL